MKPVRIRHCLFRFLRGNEKGQSAVEYLVVMAALMASLITLPNIYHTVSHTMQDKYTSYAFSVAISDPPSKQFDDTVHQGADILKEIEHVLFDIIIPDIRQGKLPGIGEIKDFFDLVKKLF